MAFLDTKLPQSGSNLKYTTTNEMQLDAFAWEPKKQNQFILSFMDADGAAIPSYLIKASAKPTIANGEVTLDHINIKRYVKGKTVWNGISITLYDAIMPNGAQAVMQWLLRHHESATGRDGYSDYYKQDLIISQLDPLGVTVEEWKLFGTFITETNFGTLDWATEDTVTIEVQLRYDYAQLTSFDPRPE